MNKKIVSISLFSFESGVFDELDLVLAEINQSSNDNEPKSFYGNREALLFLESDNSRKYVKEPYRRTLFSLLRSKDREFDLHVWKDKRKRNPYQFSIVEKTGGYIHEI